MGAQEWMIGEPDDRPYTGSPCPYPDCQRVRVVPVTTRIRWCEKCERTWSVMHPDSASLAEARRELSAAKESIAERAERELRWRTEVLGKLDAEREKVAELEAENERVRAANRSFFDDHQEREGRVVDAEKRLAAERERVRRLRENAVILADRPCEHSHHHDPPEDCIDGGYSDVDEWCLVCDTRVALSELKGEGGAL